MTDPVATIYAAALARRVATLAERDAAATPDPAIRAALAHAARVARAEQEAAERAFPAGLDLLDLYRRDALVLLDDGVGWHHAVYQAAQAQRRREANSDMLVADLLVQAPYRTDDERDRLDLLLSDTLLPPVAKGRPHGPLTKSNDALAAAQAYFEMVGTDPGKSKQKPTTGIKGKDAALAIGGPLGVSARTVLGWVAAYQRSVQVLNAAGHDGVAVMTKHIRLNR